MSAVCFFEHFPAINALMELQQLFPVLVLCIFFVQYSNHVGKFWYI